jgi:hypothetical protein
MSEFFTAIKTVLFSVLVLMVLQMKWQGETLEVHSEEWIYRSEAGAQLQTVARGAVKAAHGGWNWLQDQIRDQRSLAPRSQRTETRTDDLD